MAFSADPMGYDVVHDFAPKELLGPVYILGKKYDLPRDKEALLEDIRSKIWCTYRRNFKCISGTTLTSDAGWGCTLRCGQMLLAQALVCKHLGRDFKWPSDNDSSYLYNKILHKFLDVRGGEYSIQMIALQGQDFGRPVGQWFGPNNVAQAIKKLSAHDHYSQLAVHVCMDMLVIVDDLKATAREPHGHGNRAEVKVTNEQGEDVPLYSPTDYPVRPHSKTESAPSSYQKHTSPPNPHRFSSSECIGPSYTRLDEEKDGLRGDVALPGPVASSSPFKLKTSPSVESNEAACEGGASVNPSLKFGDSRHLELGDTSLDFMKLSIRDNSCLSGGVAATAAAEPSLGSVLEDSSENEDEEGERVKKAESEFRPILIFIPLRLGQDRFNDQYKEPLKDCLTLPQSVGFIGGKPRHALYFIGFNDNDLIYLDPHTTQPVVNAKPDGTVPDGTYHTCAYGRMHISGLDPSVALGFFCKDEADLDNLMHRLKQVVLRDSRLNMFDLTEHRPFYWGASERSPDHSTSREPFLLVDGYEDDEEFEIISWPPLTLPEKVGPSTVCYHKK